MRKLFGTDGIRGVANSHPVTTEMALRIGRAIAHIFRAGDRRHTILIGRDTRLSGTMIESALAAGICSAGMDVLSGGVLPTPAIAHLTSLKGCDAGIVISASHNPFEDNGIKIFSLSGFKLPDRMEEEIEALICSAASEGQLAQPTDIGQISTLDDAEDIYVRHILESVPPQCSFAGLKVVLDCANGAAYRVAPRILTRLGAQVACLADSPDGTNINLDCGAMHPEKVGAAVVEQRADIGIALDGDADRVILSDEEGRKVDGDSIMAICAAELKREGRLKKNTVVATVMSNVGFLAKMKELGIDVITTQVGDRYILEEMRTNGYSLGGEQSGHLIFLDNSTTGDGILAALKVMAIMKKTGKKLSKLNTMKTYPQCIVNVAVRERVDLEKIPEISSAIRDAENTLGDRGRILVRYSGTQLLCRIMVEGPSREEISAIASVIAGLIEARLN